MQKTIIAAMALAFVLAAASVTAGEGVEIGAAMPDFTLTDYTGKDHTLSDYKGKIVVLEMSSHNCPWSRGTDSQISELANKYSDKDVVFIGIDSDVTNSMEDVEAHAKEAGVPFPVVKDPENKYADRVMASRTPEIYIVDKEGKLAYHGAFDNRQVPATAGDTNYVAKALDELLAGEKVSDPKVSAWGCTIKRVAKDS